MLKEDFKELASQLEGIDAGEKITFFMMNEFGFPSVVHARMDRSK